MPLLQINLTTEQAARAAPAVGREMGLTDINGDPRDATMEEAKQYVINQLRKVVLRYEREIAASVPFDPT